MPLPGDGAKPFQLFGVIRLTADSEYRGSASNAATSCAGQLTAPPRKTALAARAHAWARAGGAVAAYGVVMDGTPRSPATIFLDAKTEAELIELDEAEALELLQSMGVEESGIDQLARVGFATLGLQTYLTAGPKESRAWTIPVGATAPQAAGVIHTDFERGFIKAEVVSYDDLVDASSMVEARSRGKVRIEGKDYVMADGDVVEFRFNV